MWYKISIAWIRKSILSKDFVSRAFKMSKKSENCIHQFKRNNSISKEEAQTFSLMRWNEFQRSSQELGSWGVQTYGFVWFSQHTCTVVLRIWCVREKETKNKNFCQPYFYRTVMIMDTAAHSNDQWLSYIINNTIIHMWGIPASEKMLLSLNTFQMSA